MLTLWLLPALAFVLPTAPQEETSTPAAEVVEASLGVLHPDELLLALDRKVVEGKDEIGLWLRQPQGEMRRVWEGEPYDSLWDLEGSVLVVERWKGRVVELTHEFEEVRAVGGFDTPVDVERDEQGRWIVVENRPGRIVCVDPSTGRRLWTRTGWRSPFDVALLDGGRLLVADSGADRVVRLGPEGTPEREWRGIDFPNAVEPTADGGFLVTNWTGGSVWRFEADGSRLWRRQVGGTLQSAEERFDGRITVFDGYAGRILWLLPDGRLEREDRTPRGAVDCETVLRP